MSRLIEVVKALGSAIEEHRDSAFDQFKELLREDTSHWRELEYKKLWKGLFYGLWNLDGEITQLEISRSIAETLADPEVTTETSVHFWKGFLMVLKDEWMMVDQHRLDKYYSLARAMLHSMFKKLHQMNWSEIRFSVYLESEIVFPLDVMSSLPMHFVEIYVEELEKILEEEESPSTLSQEAWIVLLYPFENVLKSNMKRHGRLKEKIRNFVFIPLLNKKEGDTENNSFTLETMSSFKSVIAFLDLAKDLNLEMEEDLEISSEAMLIYEKLIGFRNGELKRKKQTELKQMQKPRKRTKTSKKVTK